jgi:hypothetical protein
MCSASPPPPPDYAGAAQAQGAANETTARVQGQINNPDVYGPYGSQTVSWDGDHPTVHQTLSPEQQRLFDQNMLTQQSLAGTGTQAADSLRGIVGHPIDFGSAPQRAVPLGPNDVPLPKVQATPDTLDTSKLSALPADSQTIRNQVIDAMMSRANSDINKSQDQKVSDLVAAGIHPGNAAYDHEIEMLNRQRNDAEQQAMIAGGNAAEQAYGMDMGRRQEQVGEQGMQFGQGMQAGAQRFGQQGQLASLIQSLQGQYFGQETGNRRDAISEMLAQREMPLNEISALRSGSQVANPFSTPGYAQNTTVAPPPVFGAATQAGQYGTDVYNAQAARANSNNQTMGTLAMAAAMFF